MCGRFAITTPPQAVRSYFGYRQQPNFPPRYNIAPTQPIPIVRMNTGNKEFVLVRWGLVPSWMKEITPSKPLINARAETLLEKPSFKHAAMRRRCLLPIDGFYEWKRTKGAAPKPYFIHRKDGNLFAIAGIWEHWQGADGSEIESAAIITTTANETLAPIHHRMPVILDKTAQEHWLNVTDVSASEACKFLKPTDNDVLTAHPVSPRVNKVANDDADLLEETSEVTEASEAVREEGGANQLSLF
jgi:putative SOS response-associated peptidase YedK